MFVGLRRVLVLTFVCEKYFKTMPNNDEAEQFVYSQVEVLQSSSAMTYRTAPGNQCGVLDNGTH